MLNGRELDGVWVSEEFKKAVEKGYTNVRMQEVWHFESSTVYNKSTKEGCLFPPYIDYFIKIKQESSGYPTHAQSEAEKQRYINDYFEHEGINSTPL